MNIPYKATYMWKEGEPITFAWHKSRKNPILVIAGDSANGRDLSMGIVAEAAGYYDHVIWTDGNHEHYEGYLNHMTHSLTHNMEFFRVQSRKLPNVTYLDGEASIQFGDTLFIGANGWYDFKMAHGIHTKQQYRAYQNGSNDPRNIRFGKKNKPDKMADRQSASIAKMVKEAQDNQDVKEIVVVTHTIPHRDALIKDPNHEWYPLNGAYGNSLMSRVRLADINRKIRTWVFGHTHWIYDYFDNGIHYVTNPRGYRGEMKHPKYTPNNMVFKGIIEVDTEEPDIKSAFGEVEDEGS